MLIWSHTRAALLGVLLVLAAAPAAAPAYTPPGAISGDVGQGDYREAALFNDQNGVVAWTFDDGTKQQVKVRRLNGASATFGGGATLPGNSNTEPDLDVNPDGDGAIVWNANGPIRFAVIPSTGAISPATTLTAPGVTAESPQVAVGSANRMFFAWIAPAPGGNPAVFLRSRAPDGTLGSVAQMSDSNQLAGSPRVVSRGAGALLTWTQQDAPGHLHIMHARFIDSSGVPGAAFQVTPDGQDVSEYDVAVADDGGTTVVWREGPRIWFNKNPGAGTQLVAASGPSAFPRVAVNPQDGSGVLAWLRGDPTIVAQSLAMRSFSPTGVLAARRQVSGNHIKNVRPALAEDIGGRTTFLWEHNSRLSARTLFADGTFGPIALGTPADATTPPTIAMNDVGDVLAAWGFGSRIIGVVGSPGLDGLGGTINYAPGTTITPLASLRAADPDDRTLLAGVVEITSGCQPGDELVFTDQNGIAGNNQGCELRLLGNATVAQYQQAVRSISFRNLLSGASGDRVIAVTLRDQAQFSRPAAVRLHFMP